MAPIGILFIGATGYIGRKIALAGAAAPEVTAYALISKATQAKPERKAVLDELKDAGVQFLTGDIHDHASLVAALKQVSVVISTVGFEQLADQSKIIDAAKEAGTITRILPSDFGVTPSQKTADAIGELPALWGIKGQLLEKLKESGIPYTVVWANVFAGYFAPGLGALDGPVKDEVSVFESGDIKGYINDEADVGKFSIKAALDPRAANKTIHVEPPKNHVSQNDLIAIYEKSQGKTLKRKHVTGEELIEQYKKADPATNFVPFLHYCIWVAGDSTAPLPEGHLSTAELYPDVDYKPIEAIVGN